MSLCPNCSRPLDAQSPDGCLCGAIFKSECDSVSPLPTRSNAEPELPAEKLSIYNLDRVTLPAADKIEVQWERAWGRVGFRLGFFGMIAISIYAAFIHGFNSVWDFLIGLVVASFIGVFIGVATMCIFAEFAIVAQWLFRKTDPAEEKVSQALDDLEETEFEDLREMAGEAERAGNCKDAQQVYDRSIHSDN